MVVNELRTRLNENTVVTIGGNDYAIGKILSDSGASCLVYNAMRLPTEFERSIGMPCIPAVVKEFYPVAISENIKRDNGSDDLIIASNKQSKFDVLFQEFIRGAIEQVKFYGKGSIHSLAPSRIGGANSTFYTVVDSAAGESLDKAVMESNKRLSLHEIVQVIASLTEAVKELHDKQILHLDIKPSNIFLFENNGILSQRVALFDFDTVLHIEEAQAGNCKIGFSAGWSAPEQGSASIPPRHNEISKATDVFAIGAVLYWAVTGNRVTDDVLSQIKLNEFDFLNDIHDIGARNAVKEYLKLTLMRVPADRATLTEGSQTNKWMKHKDC